MRKQAPPVTMNLDGAFEETPSGFSRRIAAELYHLQNVRPGRKSMRWLPIAAICMLLISGGVAAQTLGVLDFLTDLTTMPLDRSAVESEVSKPLSQTSDSNQVMARARDYLWNDMSLSLAVHLAPGDADKFRLIGKGDFGVDGIHMEDIWWNGEITTMDKWLPKGKQALVVDIPEMTLGGKKLLTAIGWVPEEQGETFLLQADLTLVTVERYEKLLNADGTLTVSVPVESWVYGSDTRERAVLQLQLEAPTVEEWRKLYNGE